MHTSGVALIVGAGGGIGRETGNALTQHGSVGIVFADADYEAAAKAADESMKFANNPQYRAIATTVNVCREEDVHAMIALVVHEFGRIDYCINAAGIGAGTYLQAADDGAIQDYDRKMEVNARGTLLVMQSVIKVMQGQEQLTCTGRYGTTREAGRGAIVNLGSVLSYTVIPSMIGYVSSKHTVLALTKILALDYAASGIRINTIAPGWVNTPMMAQTCQTYPETNAMIERAVPIKRMAEPEEIADVIAFMCSPQASYMNGTGLVVDGGTSLNMSMNM